MFCDSCGERTKASVPLEVKYPDGAKTVINLCLDCNEKIKGSRKRLVVEMLRILTEDET